MFIRCFSSYKSGPSPDTSLSRSQIFKPSSYRHLTETENQTDSVRVIWGQQDLINEYFEGKWESLQSQTHYLMSINYLPLEHDSEPESRTRVVEDLPSPLFNNILDLEFKRRGLRVSHEKKKICPKILLWQWQGQRRSEENRRVFPNFLTTNYSRDQ